MSRPFAGAARVAVGDPSWDHDPPSRDVFDGALVRIGTFRATPRNPRFHDSGAIQDPVIVFPRTTVRIRHEGERAFVATPAVITLYNRGQLYRRDSVDPAGDLCEWFAFRDDVLVDALATAEPAVRERPARPFRRPFAPSEHRLYLRQRQLVRRVLAARAGALDVLAVEEEALGLLERFVAIAAAAAPAAVPDALGAGQRDLVDRLQAILGLRFHEDLSLAALAAEVGCSPFYLARLFRRATGSSIHAFRVDLRLRRSLELVAGSGRDLAAVALDLGFGSHSHFTSVFRAAYGITPSELRRTAPRRMPSRRMSGTLGAGRSAPGLAAATTRV
jgi:AraC-like DNA-binding protein